MASPLPLPGEEWKGALPEAPPAQTFPPDPPRTPPPAMPPVTKCEHCGYLYEMPEGTDPRCPRCGKLWPAPRPPLGVKPWVLHDEDRAQELIAASVRYVAAGRLPKGDWLVEVAHLIHLHGFGRRMAKGE